MPDSGEGGQGRGGNRVEEFARVSEVLGQPPAHLEVKLRLLPAGHVAVHVLDLRLQSLTVWDLLMVVLRVRAVPLRRAQPRDLFGRDAGDSPSA
jgi:hypothetical protein